MADSSDRRDREKAEGNRDTVDENSAQISGDGEEESAAEGEPDLNRLELGDKDAPARGVIDDEGEIPEPSEPA